MRSPSLLAIVPLAVLAACADARETAPPAPPDAADLVIGTGYEATPAVASDVEVHRTDPVGTPDPLPAPTPPTEPQAARTARLPAAEDPAEHHGGQTAIAISADPEPDASAAAESGEAGADDGAVGGPAATGGGKPYITRDEGPIRDPGARGGIVIIRGGPAGVDDDCAIHPRTPPMVMQPPIVTATPDLDRGVLINDRSPPGGSLAGNRPPTGHTGELHPSGAGVGITGRPLPGGRSTMTGSRPGFRGRGIRQGGR